MMLKEVRTKRKERFLKSSIVDGLAEMFSNRDESHSDAVKWLTDFISAMPHPKR